MDGDGEDRNSSGVADDDDGYGDGDDDDEWRWLPKSATFAIGGSPNAICKRPIVSTSVNW